MPEEARAVPPKAGSRTPRSAPRAPIDFAQDRLRDALRAPLGRGSFDALLNWKWNEDAAWNGLHCAESAQRHSAACAIPAPPQPGGAGSVFGLPFRFRHVRKRQRGGTALVAMYTRDGALCAPGDLFPGTHAGSAPDRQERSCDHRSPSHSENGHVQIRSNQHELRSDSVLRRVVQKSSSGYRFRNPVQDTGQFRQQYPPEKCRVGLRVHAALFFVGTLLS